MPNSLYIMLNNFGKLRIYSLIVSVLVLIGETLILLNTDKYYPLSIDDLAIALSVIVICSQPLSSTRVFYLMLCWAIMMGNLYAMLFNRLDPIYGSGERIYLLTILLSVSFIGLISAYFVYIKETYNE